MQEFEFPTNIKQVGSITHGIKIYVEDYVCLYLQQYAESLGYKECLAVLLGRQMVIDGQKVLFISGAVQAKQTQRDGGIEIFTKDTWDYVESQMEKYFGELEVLGWMQSQPGYGVYLNTNYANYHKEIFTRAYQVMFVIDPVEKANAFFITDTTKKTLIESKGYFVYYDKNTAMHEYMLDNKVVKDKILEYEEDEDEDDEAEILYELKEDEETSGKINSRRTERQSATQKRLLNMLVSVSGVLLVICFVMGVGLLQNEDRITRLEGDLIKINTSYSSVIETIKNGKTEAVFAAQPKQEELVEAVENPTEELVIVKDVEPTVKEEVAAQPVIEEVAAKPAETEAVVIREDGNEVAKQNSIPDKYIVQEGDNLLYISVEFYGTTNMVDEIMSYNGLTEPDKIYIGKIIKLPPIR